MTISSRVRLRRFGRLADAVRIAAEEAGYTMHKPAGQPAYEAVVMPREAWDRIRRSLDVLDEEDHQRAIDILLDEKEKQ